MDLADLILNVHIGVAIIAVATGTVAVISRKSQYSHKTFGKMYVISIIATAATAFALMSIPGYWNSIMFLVGLFNVYFAVSGYRSLALKTVFTMERVSWWDKSISITMFFIAMAMFYHGIFSITEGDMWGYVLIIYSAFGVLNVYRDFKLYNTREFGTFTWMQFHATKMIGSYIGAVTAVCVTQLHEHMGLITWFLPSVLGLMYMAYWIKKIKTSPESVFDW